MAVQVPSFLVPFADTPKPDLSWLDTISQVGGDLIDQKAGQKLVRQTIERSPVVSGQREGSFLTNLIGTQNLQNRAPQAAPVSRSAVPNQPPIPGIQRQQAPMEGYRNAIGSLESAGSGDYVAVGPTHPKLGRALGRYQVMEANIGPWSQEILGRTVTPEEFMANPQLQDAIFDGKFQQYVQKFGPEGAAQAWFGGEGGVGKTARTDSLGTSIGEYGNKFTNALGASGGSVDAVNAMGAGGQVPGYVDPMVVNPNSRPQAAAQPMPQPMPANQVADASGNVLAPAVTPVQRGSISADLIAKMVTNPYTREYGLQLWKQNVEGPGSSQSWEFATLDDGTLVRQNKQTGAIERVGNFAKPEGLQNVSKGGTLYDPNTRQWITPPGGPGAPDAPEYGLAPIYGTDEQGRTVIGQLSKDGTFQLTPMPEGFSPTPGISNTDLGTTVITRNNRTGAIVDTRAKDVEGTAEQTADGKARSEGKAALPQIEASASQMLATIDSLDGDPYLGNMLGAWDSRTPNLTSNAARVQSKMDQIGGQAFLQAFNMLRGAGQITEVEGTKATNAMARLNTAQTPGDYRAALKDLRDVVNTALANARQKAGVSSAPASSGGGDYKSRYGLE